MARKRKTLPKDFAEMLTTASLAELTAVFDRCEITARGGISKSTALGFTDCPDELIIWLAEQGLAVDSPNDQGQTPVAERVYCADPVPVEQIRLLVALGADLEATDIYGQTPFQTAVLNLQPHSAAVLLEEGAAFPGSGCDPETLLAQALERARNIEIPEAVAISRLLMRQGTSVTAQMRAHVTQIGERFEHFREDFNPDSLEEHDAALKELYSIFGVEPVAQRVRHDGRSPIVAAPGPWQSQHAQLWKMLVPGAGPAATEQGELIRITGRVTDEIYRNGAVNWDADYRVMVDAGVRFLGTRSALSPELLADAHAIAPRLRTGRADEYELDRFSELAVLWVERNPEPYPLNDVDYSR